MNTTAPIPDWALGIDLGGSSVKLVGVTPDGTLLRSWRVEFDAEVPGDFKTVLLRQVAQCRAELGEPGRIGVSAPGLAARDARSIAVMPGRLDGLEGLDWAQFLGRTDCVPVLNDGHAALLGETWTGAARGCRDAILLTLGTGVGGAALVDGQLLRGFTGKAGHFGHMSLNPSGAPDICNAPGSLEDAVGNHNIRKRSYGRFETTWQLIEAVRAGDPFAREVWDQSILSLAAAIASLTNCLDPEVAILGGGIAEAGDLLFPPVQALLDRFEWRPTGHAVRLIPAALGGLAGAWGAARNALNSPVAS
jgi:glucokinase